MIDYETIKPLVERIARYQASKMTKSYSYSYIKDITEEFTQELYVKVYELLAVRPDASIELIAFSLFKRLGDMLRVMNKRNATEISSDFIEQYAQSDTYQQDKHYSEKTTSDIIEDATLQHTATNDLELQTTIDYILAKTEGYPAYIKKYVIAKLKLEGYLAESAYPEVDITSVRLDGEGTEHSKIIEDVLHLKHARSGGPKAFKTLKRELFYDIIYELGLEDVYKKGYKITYALNDGTVKTKVLHSYSEESVIDVVLANTNVNSVVNIELND